MTSSVHIISSPTFIVRHECFSTTATWVFEDSPMVRRKHRLGFISWYFFPVEDTSCGGGLDSLWILSPQQRPPDAHTGLTKPRSFWIPPPLFPLYQMLRRLHLIQRSFIRTNIHLNLMSIPLFTSKRKCVRMKCLFTLTNALRIDLLVSHFWELLATYINATEK